MFIFVYNMCINVYVYVSIVYMLCSPMLEEIKNLSIYLSIIIKGCMFCCFGIMVHLEKYKMHDPRISIVNFNSDVQCWYYTYIEVFANM